VDVAIDSVVVLGIDIGLGAGVGNGDGAGDEWGDKDDIRWVALRAFRTSVGEGISVLRYLASGVMSCVDREQKCRLKASEASMRALSSPFIAFSSCLSKTRSFEI